METHELITENFMQQVQTPARRNYSTRTIKEYLRASQKAIDGQPPSSRSEAHNMKWGLVYSARQLINEFGTMAQIRLQQYIQAYTHVCEWMAAAPRAHINGKRKKLRYFGENWREKMWAASEGHRYRREMAVIELTGLRPEEFSRGVDVEFDAESNLLQITISGAKEFKPTRNDQGPSSVPRGIKKRTISYDITQNEIAKFLAATCWLSALIKSGNENKVSHHTFTFTPKQIRRLLETIQKRAGVGTTKSGKVKHKVTGYCYRHCVADDFRKHFFARLDQDKARIQLAKAMGHQATSSATAYGNPNARGGKNIGIIKVESDAKIRLCDHTRAADLRCISRKDLIQTNCPTF